jgi:hypothetical protein
MKHICYLLIIYLLSFCSCANSNKAVEKSCKSSRMSNYKAFLVLNNGDTIKGIKWKLKGNWNLLVDGKKFKDSEVKPFQSPYGIATRYQSSAKANSFIDQWAYYLVRGKINMFSVEIFSGYFTSRDSKTGFSSTSPSYTMAFFYNLNTEGTFFRFESKKLRELINDCPQAIEEFNKSGINDKSFLWAKKAIKILNTYNSYSK